MEEILSENSEEKADEQISFADLGLDDVTLAAISKKGFEVPSPIQVLAIPRLLNGDANVIARARTGTGKTAAFGLPLVQRLREESDHVRAVVLEPTRELAIQTCKELQSFTSGRYPRVSVVYGGASMGEQLRDLRRGVDIVVGTPGRIQDHIDRGSLKIDKIDYFILDEGDEMLDMGFVDDIENIFAAANPASRILLFSATMPPEIMKIAQKFMGEYEIVEEEGVTEEPLLIEQKYWVVRESDKVNALIRLIDMAPDFFGLVFTQTKMEADMVSRQLDEHGYQVAALHGDIPQNQREKILARFRSKKTRILVATDVAARGIDISGLSHVVNYELPFDGATYVHRIGRTGRAGSSGCAVTFVRPEEQRRRLAYLRAAVRRASKGEMVAEAVPAVEDVIKIKKERLFDDIKKRLGLKVKTVTDETASEDNIESEDKLISVDSMFEAMAENLCENNDSEKVLAAVLSIMFGKELDKSRYGSINPVRSRRDDRDRGERYSSNSDQMRIYVQLGRRDGFNPREIADYFSGLLKIPGRQVDRIDVSDSFSLVSLPTSSARLALDMAQRDSSMPHMHVDTKDSSSRRGGFRGGRFSNGERSNRFSGGRRGGRDSSRSHGGKSSRAAYSSNHARANVHTPTERNSNAGLYKKTSDDRY
ncbi:MAG: DEAD/DEAH box helicase [Treponema sp.]|nr:DEAD/DEAH box helicase [Treponema sp.]